VGDQGGVFPLAIGAEGSLEEEQVRKEWVDQRAHPNGNIRFRFKVVLFQQNTVTESR
jgi:hypothetical protein